MLILFIKPLQAIWIGRWQRLYMHMLRYTASNRVSKYVACCSKMLFSADFTNQYICVNLMSNIVSLNSTCNYHNIAL